MAIYFYSETLTWIDTIGTNLVFAAGDQLEALRTGQGIETETLVMPADLSICSFQQVSNKELEPAGYVPV